MRAGRADVLAMRSRTRGCCPRPRGLPADRITAVVCAPLHKSGRFVAAMAVHQATAKGVDGRRDRAADDRGGAVPGVAAAGPRPQRAAGERGALPGDRRARQRRHLARRRRRPGPRGEPGGLCAAGYSRDEHLGPRIGDIVCPAEQPRLAALWSALRAGRSRTQAPDGAGGTAAGWCSTEHALGRTAGRRPSSAASPGGGGQRLSASGCWSGNGRPTTSSGCRRTPPRRPRRPRHPRRSLPSWSPSCGTCLGVEAVAAWELRAGALLGLGSELARGDPGALARTPLDAGNPATDAVGAGSRRGSPTRPSGATSTRRSRPRCRSTATPGPRACR